MEFTTSLNATLTDWLANVAAGRKALFRQGAQRFAALVSAAGATDSEHPPAEGMALPSVTLRVNSGLHHGATMELMAREYLIGSADDCDIVLRDAQVAAEHCRLTRGWSGFSVRDLRAPKPQVIAPKAVAYEDGAIEAEYDIGGVLIALRQQPPLRVAAGTEQGRKSTASWPLLAAVGAALVLSIVAFGSGDRAPEAAPTALADQILVGNEGLLAHGFGTVHFRQDARGELEITGLVADTAQKQRLDRWLKSAKYEVSRARVHVMSELAEQARHALADDSLQVIVVGDHLRLQGMTSRVGAKARVRALADDLRGTVGVEDGVVYSESRPTSAGPFPIQLRGVMVGDPSYFLTDSGARYFVGGVLPDGAEVVSIEAQQIRFRQGGKVLVYKLE